MAANDGQSLSSQSPQIQQTFNATFGAGASQQWDTQHNAAIGGGSDGGSLASTLGPVTAALTQAGNFTANQLAEAKRQFDQNFGLAMAKLTGSYQGQPTLEEMLALGSVNGQPTLAAQEALGLVNGQPTLAAQELQQKGGLGVLDLLSRLQGPSNAFAQQAVLHGLNASGLSNAVDAISGKYGLPRFQAPQALAQPASVNSLLGNTNIGWAGGGQVNSGAIPGGPVNDGFTGLNWGQNEGNTQIMDAINAYGMKPGYHLWDPMTGEHVQITSLDQAKAIMAGRSPMMAPPLTAGLPSDLAGAYRSALPPPNQINGTAWQSLDADTKAFLQAAYRQAGYSDNDVTSAVSAGLPQFRAPAAGGISPAPGMT